MARRFFAGLDWSATSGHDVAVTDHAGTLMKRARVSDDTEGVRQLLQLLTVVARRRKNVTVGIETGRGLFVAALLRAGQPLVVLNPTLVARYRSRLSTTRKKSDRGDSALIAHILRVDGAAHRPLPAVTPQAAAIREIARAQHQAARTRVIHHLRLAALLRDYHPAMLAACAGLPDGLPGPQARALLAAAPTPAQARRLTMARIATLLAAAGRVRLVDAAAGRVADLLRTQALRQPAAVEEAMGQQALGLLAMLEAATLTGDRHAEQLRVLFEQHPHAEIYTSFPGMGTLLGGRLLGELGDDLDRWEDARALKAYCGATPLTWASGASTVVRRRRNTSPILSTTGHRWAFCALTHSPGARAHYDRRRQAGDRHATALRHLYARMLGQLYFCLTRQTTYEEEHAYPDATSGRT